MAAWETLQDDMQNVTKESNCITYILNDFTEGDGEKVLTSVTLEMNEICKTKCK